MTNATAHDPPDDLPAATSDQLARNRPSWANLWQVPAIGASALLIVLGLIVAGRGGEAPDGFDTILAQVEEHIAGGELDRARLAFDTRLEPLVGEATPAQQGAYHAAVADWVAASQEARNLSAEPNNRLIAERYERAVESGAELSPARLERWASALIDLGELEAADLCLARLEALAATEENALPIRERVNRLLRRIVEQSLRREGASQEALLAALERLGSDPLVSAEDDAWVSAQQAAIRLEAGDAQGAIDHLLLDIRRLEDRELSPVAWGRLDALLGRGYWSQGRYDYALWHLDSALDRLGSAPERGDALYLIGRIAYARGDFDRAHALFDEVVRGYVGTPAHLPAILARAEVESVRGDHEASLADYREVAREVTSTAPRSDVPARAVAASLIDRHDAAITRGELSLAFDYASIAESLFERSAVPVDVLQRLGSTSRQIADDLLADALASTGALPDFESLDRLGSADPALRHEANEHLARAGDYFIRHARALTSLADGGDAWAESLWYAGDCYDMAGDRERAIEHFREYIAGRPPDDPRRAEVVFRLAQAQEASLDPEAAVISYEQVIREHPRSPFGTQSHVSLARCLVALDRVGEAEQQLREVLEGRYPITPEAVDYRRALIALGVIHHETGRFDKAIERLEEAIDRYPDDARSTEVRFRLADSARRHAAEIDARLAEEAGVAPADRAGRLDRRRMLLERALVLFDQVCAEWSHVAHAPEAIREFERAAWLGRGDCAYALGEWEEAARWYDQAARRYSDDCASLHAIVQTVNCFVRLGDDARAEVAHRNALARLRQLPDSAFEAPGAMLDRAAWEQWLQNRPPGRAVETPSSALTTAANSLPGETP